MQYDDPSTVVDILLTMIFSVFSCISSQMFCYLVMLFAL